jgi:B9 domain-containing protein 1
LYFQGIDTGISQVSSRNFHSNQEIVWNFPVDVTFKSTNVHGWPRISFSVYGLDFLGRDVIRGYGSALIPVFPGNHAITVDMYKPLAGSALNNMISWLFGDSPEV